MKNRDVLMTIITVLALALGAVAWAAPSRGQNEAEGKNSQGQEKLAKQARITMEQARETALKRAPGNVESGELEKEHGKLVYSFDIRNSKGTITEVQVSAITGKVVRVEHENKKQEAAEKEKEAKEKASTH
jgi:uncharacterized membrane protein YkoI